MGTREKTIKFFEYGEFMCSDYMNDLIKQAKYIKRGKVLESKLTFSGKSRGIANMIKVKGSKSSVYGIIYEIPKHRLKSLFKKRINFYKPKIVKVKVKLEDGKLIRALTLISETFVKSAIPTSDYYSRIAEGYIYNSINKKRLDRTIERIPINNTFISKKSGR